MFWTWTEPRVARPSTHPGSYAAGGGPCAVCISVQVRTHTCIRTAGTRTLSRGAGLRPKLGSSPPRGALGDHASPALNSAWFERKPAGQGLLTLRQTSPEVPPPSSCPSPGLHSPTGLSPPCTLCSPRPGSTHHCPAVHAATATHSDSHLSFPPPGPAWAPLRIPSLIQTVP